MKFAANKLGTEERESEMMTEGASIGPMRREIARLEDIVELLQEKLEQEMANNEDLRDRLAAKDAEHEHDLEVMHEYWKPTEEALEKAEKRLSYLVPVFIARDKIEKLAKEGGGLDVDQGLAVQLSGLFFALDKMREEGQ